MSAAPDRMSMQRPDPGHSHPAALTVTDPVLLAFAEQVGSESPVTVVGGRTRWDRGGAVAAGTREVKAPTGVVSYLPEEMIVTVRAGTTVAELQRALAERGQEAVLPDPDGAGTATVGGVLAVGDSGMDRLGNGPLRDAVLQVRYVSAEGRLVTGGGPTVKNVSGFDLCRLMVGALGTLGCLAEVVLRTRPIPACSQWWQVEGPDPVAAFRALYRPRTVLWDGRAVWVCLAGHPRDVADQAAELARLGSAREVAGPPPLGAHRWSLDPGEALTTSYPGPAVVEVGVGTAHTTAPQPIHPLPAPLLALHHRLKANFDPTGRLNPGRCPWGRASALTFEAEDGA